MIRLSFIAGGLAFYLAARFLSRRRARGVVCLRGGRRVRLLSSVALLDGSAGDLLALEYFSPLPTADPEALRVEARSLVQTVAARAAFAGCTNALVTVRRRNGSPDEFQEDLLFTFRRSDPGTGWSSTEGLE